MVGQAERSRTLASLLRVVDPDMISVVTYAKAVSMHQIQLRDAKARLSAVVDDAMAGNPALITRHGKPQAVLVSYEEWTRMQALRPRFGALLMAAPALIGELPARNSSAARVADL
jgi:prevent-host-death family protein